MKILDFLQQAFREESKKFLRELLYNGSCYIYDDNENWLAFTLIDEAFATEKGKLLFYRPPDEVALFDRAVIRVGKKRFKEVQWIGSNVQKTQ